MNSPFTKHSVWTRRQFLGAVGATVAAGSLNGFAADAAPLASFFVVGDTHFLADKMDPEKLDATSAAYTSRLVDTLNRLPGTEFSEAVGGGKVPAPNGVLHAGDVIDTGDKNGATQLAMQRTEWAGYVAQFGLTGAEGRLKFPVFEVPGNHDSPHGTGHAIEQMAARQRARKGLKAVSKNGLHSSWNWGGVHFITLGLIVGTDRGVARKRRYAAMESLAFLIEDLANTPKDQPLVLMHHVDMARYTVAKPDTDYTKWEWDPADVAAFYAAIKGRRAAIFYGHTHFRNVFRWDGVSTKAADGVAVFNVDNASHFNSPAQAFFHVEVRGDGFTVREFETRDGWETGRWTPQVWKAAV
ncbi:MAG: twin-arginine translocation signal domain-containing protein [Pedosphaera sp.]|nr:twin-arginine translocation signal domain-containing protein [Pedosphaera sp.]